MLIKENYLVIGDEILRGDVIDTNSSHITRKLHKLGVNVRKVSKHFIS